MRNWLSNVSSQLVAALIIASVSALGLWLASLTPMIVLFAPYSYLIAFLLAVSAVAFTAILAAKARQHWFPPSAPPPSFYPPEYSADEGEPPRPDAEIEQLSSRVVEIEGTLAAIRAELQSARETSQALQDFKMVVGPIVRSLAGRVLAEHMPSPDEVEQKIEAHLEEIKRGEGHPFNQDFEILYKRTNQLITMLGLNQRMQDNVQTQMIYYDTKPELFYRVRDSEKDVWKNGDEKVAWLRKSAELKALAGAYGSAVQMIRGGGGFSTDPDMLFRTLDMLKKLES